MALRRCRRRVDPGPLGVCTCVTGRAGKGDAIAAAASPWFAMTMSLREQLASLPPSLTSTLRGFDPDRLIAWAQAIGTDRDRRNRLAGSVEPPAAGDVEDAPVAGTAEHERLCEQGRRTIARGEVAL